MNTPLPLSEGQAIAQALRLRARHGFSYPVLARLMGEYHGVHRAAGWWQQHCRERGAPVSQPWNVTPAQRKAAA